MTAPIWTLGAAFGLGGSHELVAVVGGGGKTSLLFALAASLPGRTVITTTTRIFAAQMKIAPAVCRADDLELLGAHLARHGRCLVVGDVEGDKALGVDPALPGRLLQWPDVDRVLVEADGSRMRPVKAPAEHEPVIPTGTTLLVPVAGIDALDGPLDTVAHRPERVRRLLDAPADAGTTAWLTDDDRLTPAGLARVLTHAEGGLKGLPPAARAIPLLNKVGRTDEIAAAREAAWLMLREPRVDRVILGAMREDEPVREVWRRVTAVVLAAGESTRMGRNKLHLPWGENTVLGQTLDNLSASAVSEILVVTGHEAERSAAEAADRGLATVHNRDYANEMLSSLQAALPHVSPRSEAVLVVLGDQPMVGPGIIDQLLTAFAAHPADLVAPFYDGRRGNPVLIGRQHFDELLSLPRDAAPRALLERHPADLLAIAVDSDAVLHDLDRPEDYERWRPR